MSKKGLLILVIAFAVCLIGWSSYGEGEKITVNVDTVSAYVYKGATYNDGLVIQPSLEISSGAITIGGWVNYDIGDYNGTLLKDEVSEVDFYANYSFPIEVIEVTAGYSTFIYPHSTYDTEQEVSLSAKIDKLPLNPSATVKYGVDGGLAENLYYEVGVSQEFKAVGSEFTIGALAAYADPYQAEAGWSHYEITLAQAISFKYVDTALSVTHLGLIDSDVLPRSTKGGGFDVDLVGKFSISKSF